jgi:hypothetical protein
MALLDLSSFGSARPHLLLQTTMANPQVANPQAPTTTLMQREKALTTALTSPTIPGTKKAL